MMTHVVYLSVIATLSLVVWTMTSELKRSKLSHDEQSRALILALQIIAALTARAESLEAQYEEAMDRGFQLYQELRVAERDLARFRSLYESFSKYAVSLAARADALDAARLAAEKKELGGRLFELVLGWFFPECGRRPSYGGT
jgi:chromosome segregation ATPase